MGIMSAKYKAHKFVNIIFYIIVFIFGFLVGIGAKKLVINNFLSRVLIIDDVEAFTFESNNYNFSYDFVIDSFERDSNFDISEYPNIICGLWHYDAGYDTLTCNALSSDLSDYTFTTTDSTFKSIKIIGSKYFFNYRIDTSTYISDTYLRTTDSNVRVFNNNTSYYLAHSNFFVPDVSYSFQPINDIYSNILDSFSTSLTPNNNYSISSSNYYNEQFLFNFFNYYIDIASLNYSFNNFSNVYTIFNSSTDSRILYCSHPLTIYSKFEGSSYSFDFPSLQNCLSFNILSNSVKISGGSGGSSTYSTRSYYLASTDDYSELFTNRFKSVLDFSSYITPEMVFDENLFTNDPNFKEVCVNNYDTFSITSKEIQDYDNNNSPLYHSNDFIWFKNGVKGISTWLYDSEDEDHVVLFNNDDNNYIDDPYGWWFWFNSADEINTYWNSPNSPGIELVTNGYTDKYKYYNYTAYPFTMTFTENYHRYQVFWFRDPYIEYLDGIIVDDSNQYCFYIKNEYDVNILNKNENGDLYGDITVLGDETFSDKTYKNELDKDVDGLFSTIVNFISRIRSTVNFINSNILNLYASMPLIVRMFIMSLLTLLVVRILIGMVIK